MSNDIRRIFTLILGKDPELLFQSGADTNDPYVKTMVKNLCADRAKVLTKESGFFIFTRMMPERKLFRAFVTTPDGAKVAALENVLGTNQLTIKVDPLSLMAAAIIYNVSVTPEELIQFFTQALMFIVGEYVPESAQAAREDAKNPDPEPEPEPEKCRDCDPDIKALCMLVRGVN